MAPTDPRMPDISIGRKYRSAVYAFSREQKKLVNKLLDQLQEEFKEKLVTKSFLFRSFKSSEEAFKNYYLKNPDKPFCKSYIDPKLKFVLEKYVNYVK